MTIHVSIKLYATLGALSPKRADRYPVSEGISVADLLRQLQVPLQEAKLIFINGRRAELDAKLHGGERIGVFPPVGGG